MPCICDQCDLFAQVTCPRVSPDGKEMCLNFQGAQTNSLQQLKAEIAALANELSHFSRIDLYEGELHNIVAKMRQLSAV